MARTSTKPRRTSPFYLPSAFDLFIPSRDLFLDNFFIFSQLFFIPFIFWVHSWIDTPAGSGHWLARMTDANYSWPGFPPAYFDSFIGFSIVWLVITLVAGTAVQVMLQQAQLQAIGGKKPQLAPLWREFKKSWQSMLTLYLVIAVVVGIWFLPDILISGFLAPIALVGLYFLRRYMFAPYVMLDKKCGVSEAMGRSHTLSNINPASVWGLIGVMSLISVIALVPIIGSFASFVLGALYSFAPVLRYEQLKKLAN